MDKTTEHELRQDIKEINGKLTDIQISIAALTVKQNTGAWIVKTLITVITASICGFFGAHFSKWS